MQARTEGERMNIVLHVRKMVSVCLAVFLACMLIPLLPQQSLAQKEERDVPQLIQEMTFDLTDPQEGAYVQEHPLSALFAEKAVKKPAIPEGALRAIRVAAGCGDDESLQVDWCAYRKADVPVVDDADMVQVEEMGEGWRFVVSEGVHTGDVAQVSVRVTGGVFQYSTCVDAADEDAAQDDEEHVRTGVVEVDLSDTECIVSYAVSLTNAQEDDAAMLAQLSVPDQLIYQTTAESAAIKLKAKCEYEARIRVRNEEDLDVSIAIKDGQLSVLFKPKRMFDSEEVLIELSWGSWRSSVAIQVGPPSKKKIAISLADQPFRLQEEQVYAIRKELDSHAEEYGFAHADLVDARECAHSPFCSPVVEYPSPLVADAFDAEALIKIEPAFIDRYELAQERVRFHVNAVQDEPTPEQLFLNGATKDNWVNTVPVARYEGYELSTQLQDEYQIELPMNAAEGSYADQLLYARSLETGVITRIKAAYNLDMTAPVFESIRVDGEQKVFDDTAFLHDSAHVAISATDPQPNVMTSESPTVSGLSAKDAHIEYVDERTGKRQTKDIVQLSEDRRSGTFAFDVDGDQDVALRSIKGFLWDEAGNQAATDLDDVSRIPEEVMRIVADASAPELFVSFDVGAADDTGFFNTVRTATFTIHESHFKYVQRYDGDQPVVTITENGIVHTFRASQFVEQGADIWSVAYCFSNDADYVVTAQARDLVGKASESYRSAFTVDCTAPSLDVSFDEGHPLNGSYYHAARTANVAVTERNFDPNLIRVIASAEPGNADFVEAAQVSTWSGEGDVHSCTVFFPGDGVYRLEVAGADEAANPLPAYACSEFTVDTAEPEVVIQINGEDARSRHAFCDECAVTVELRDANIDPLSEICVMSIGLTSARNPYAGERTDAPTQIAFASASPAYLRENDGIYRLEVNAQDLAGNSKTEIVEWSVNRFGSTYYMDEQTQDMVSRGCIRPEDLHDIRITEVNPSGVAQESVLVSVAQGTNMYTLERDGDYSFRAKEEEPWPSYEYVIGKDRFSSDGMYQVIINSSDVAGNDSMNALLSGADGNGAAEIAFAVDSTAPLITFSGADDRNITAHEHEVSFMVADNVQLASAIVRVNGKEERAFSPEELIEPGLLSVSLQERDKTQVVSVEAVDRAGNIGKAETVPLLVNTNPFLRLLHDPWTLIALVGGAAAAAAFVAREAQRKKTVRLHMRGMNVGTGQGRRPWSK